MGYLITFIVMLALQFYLRASEPVGFKYGVGEGTVVVVDLVLGVVLLMYSFLVFKKTGSISKVLPDFTTGLVCLLPGFQHFLNGGLESDFLIFLTMAFISANIYAYILRLSFGGIGAFHVGQFLKLIDQVGNVLAGGYSTSTVSGRLGYLTTVSEHSLTDFQRQPLPRRIIAFMRDTVDWAFRPMDGPNHCLRAYQGDNKKQDQYRHGSMFNLLVMSVLVVFVCLFIGAIARLVSAVGLPLPTTV